MNRCSCMSVRPSRSGVVGPVTVWISVMIPPALGRRGDRGPEPFEAFGGRAQRELELLRPQAVAMQRVVDVDAHAAVQVLRGEAHAVAGVAGPDLRDRDLLGRGPLLAEQPRGVLHDEAQALD